MQLAGEAAAAKSFVSSAKSFFFSSANSFVPFAGAFVSGLCSSLLWCPVVVVSPPYDRRDASKIAAVEIKNLLKVTLGNYATILKSKQYVYRKCIS